MKEEKAKELETARNSVPPEETFSEEEWSKEYDTKNPLIEIPPEIVEDIDNDVWLEHYKFFNYLLNLHRSEVLTFNIFKNKTSVIKLFDQ